jgi:soluble lytic murein transglycosylase
VVEALRLDRQGDAEATTAMLRAIAEADPTGRTGDEASLVLGNLLIGREKHAEALPLLERAEKGTLATEYAAVLFVRAVVEGGITDRFEDAERRALDLVSGGREASEFVRSEARFLLVKLNGQRQQWEKVVATGSALLQADAADQHAGEARWLVAAALRSLGRATEAHDAYATIWYEAPASPWARQAHEVLVEIESSQGVPPRALDDEEHYDFIKKLQGLHDDALSEIAAYLARSGAKERDGALYLRASSQYSLRKNDDCVRTFGQLRVAHPASKHLPGAAVLAIRALRRGEGTADIRRWTDWVVAKYPRHPKANEARYNLGTYLLNVVDKDEGIQVLESLVADAPKARNGDDALWNVAWAHQLSGRSGESVSAMSRLLESYPDSGYRKSALYWVARLVASHDRVRAIDGYQALLREVPHDYYGHLAAANLAALGVSPGQVGNGRPLPPVDRLDRPDARSDEAYQLAANLKKAGLYDFAAHELLRVRGLEHDSGLQFALADLYSLSGNTWEAHSILKKHFPEFITAGSRDERLVPMDFWYACYPYNYREIIRRAVVEAGLDRSGIDPTLVASLIRMESRFHPTAVSRVGAVGLMQLMPETAAAIARQLNASPPTRSDLFNPETNIRYGVHFLKARVTDFGGDWFPAICSYNAGVGPVRGWWSKKPVEQPQDEFIETIPYVDTRLYIKQILGDYQNYRWIYKQGA